MKQKVVMEKPKEKVKPNATIMENPPKTMWEAFLIASKHPRIVQSYGTYLEEIDTGEQFDEQPEAPPKVAVCAIGALFTMCATERQILKEIDNGGEREPMIKIICKGIKGSCDPVPFEVWRKYDKSEDNEQDYNSVAKSSRRWVDLAEDIFEDGEKSFAQLSTIFKKYGK